MRRQTVGEVAVRAVGLRTAWYAFTYAVAWGMAAQSLGHDPESMEEYWVATGTQWRKAYREQAAFREAFASFGWETPRPLLDLGDVSSSEPTIAAAQLFGAVAA